MLRWLWHEENRKARRFVAWLLVSIAVALGVGLGRGAAESVFAHGWAVIPAVAREREWQTCYGAASTEERFGACSARAEDAREPVENRAVAYATMGNLLVGEDPAAAIGRYDLAIGLDASNINNHTLRASALLSLGDVEQAEASLEAARAINASDFSLQNLQGELWFQRGAYTEAARRFGELIDGLAEFEAQLQQQRTADIRANRPYISLNATVLDAQTQLQLHLWRSISLFNAGDREAADQERDAALALDADAMPLLGHWCGTYAFQSYNPAASRAICDVAVAYSPENTGPRLHRAIAALRAGAWRSAVGDSDFVINETQRGSGSRPDISTQAGQDEMLRRAAAEGARAQALYARGMARQYLGQEAVGQRDIAEAIATNSSVSLFFERIRSELDRQMSVVNSSELRPRLAP